VGTAVSPEQPLRWPNPVALPRPTRGGAGSARISRPPLLTPRPIALAQGPPGAGGDVSGCALSPAPRPAAGPDVRWRPPRSSGLICPGRLLRCSSAAPGAGLCQEFRVHRAHRPHRGRLLDFQASHGRAFSVRDQPGRSVS